ncbi:hypothetical protein MKX03_025858 [Papaver bracteatum]|nr:hypothetical protein MKX03_025858 [Papaver bracteatum]
MNNLIEEVYPQMSGDGMNHLTNNQDGGRRKRSKNRRPGKEQHHGGTGGGFDGGGNNFAPPPAYRKNDKYSSTQRHNSMPPQSSSSSILRKPVDLETANYFLEIANIFEGAEETRGKELELSTDYIISADLDGFFQNSANVFPLMIAVHLQDNDMYAIIEQRYLRYIPFNICVIVVKPVDVMCDRYGSHVLKSLLCFCKGVPLGSLLEFHVTKSSSVLAKRFDSKTALKLLAGEDTELMNITPTILACHVILIVVPETLYHEILTKNFSNRLFEVSSTHFGRSGLIWKELGGKLRELLELGSSGVVASDVAATQKLHTNEKKCSEALAAAVCSTSGSSNCIVPQLLFLESYFSSKDKSNWKWGKDGKMHVLGGLMLQAVFKFPSGFIQQCDKHLSMETNHVLEAAKDAGGGRVIDCVLISLRETITPELLAVRPELSKTKQGPHLLRKLDNGFAARPDQWKSRQESKQTAYREVYDAFVNAFLVNFSPDCHPLGSVKKIKVEVDKFLAFSGLEASMAKLGFSGFKRHHSKGEERGGGKKFAKLSVEGNSVKRENKV